jgi:copper chaperone CopZ
MQSNKLDNKNFTEISLPTMQCGMCVANIENSLKNVNGIDNVKINFQKLNVVVRYNSEIINTQEIEQLISKAGYRANNIEADLEAYEKLASCCKVPEWGE